MKYPLIIASLILASPLLTACKPALIPPVMQGDIHAATDADWKRSPPSISSGHDTKSPVTGISLESTDSLRGARLEPAQSSGAMGNGSRSDESDKAAADRSLQSKSQLTRKILALQLLQAMSAARP